MGKRKVRKTRINPISKKQRDKNKCWTEITNQVCRELGHICQYCGRQGQRTDRDRWDWLDGHHIIKRRFNIHTKENCYPCHRPCHNKIEYQNLRVLVGDYKTRALFL